MCACLHRSVCGTLQMIYGVHITVCHVGIHTYKATFMGMYVNIPNSITQNMIFLFFSLFQFSIFFSVMCLYSILSYLLVHRWKG